MSTDRELLELAAKADGRTNYRYIEPEMEKRLVNERGLKVWNPLTDDGDALRLAAKLNLWDALRRAHRILGSEGALDIYTATRRSIVLSAAEIGWGMA